MKTQIAVFAFVSLLSIASAIQCHFCSGVESECGVEALNKTDMAKVCGLTSQLDICFYQKDINGDGIRTYTRKCGKSSELTNGKTNNCAKYGAFGETINVCSCTTEFCNGAVVGSASLGLALFLAALVAKLSM